MIYEQKVQVFYSDTLTSKEIEEFLKKEINPSNYQYRCDYNDFNIFGNKIFLNKRIYDKEKRKYFLELQKKLDIFSIFKRHRELIQFFIERGR